MKTLSPVFQKLLQLLALSFVGLAIYYWVTLQEIKGYAVLGACYSWLFSYYFSDSFKQRLSPERLISREIDCFVIGQTSGFAKTKRIQEIEISRISSITCSDNMLSIIIDGNGQGYDFQLLAKAKEITSRMTSLLTDEEREGIKLRQV